MKYKSLSVPILHGGEIQLGQRAIARRNSRCRWPQVRAGEADGFVRDIVVGAEIDLHMAGRRLARRLAQMNDGDQDVAGVRSSVQSACAARRDGRSACPVTPTGPVRILLQSDIERGAGSFGDLALDAKMGGDGVLVLKSSVQSTFSVVSASRTVPV